MRLLEASLGVGWAPPAGLAHRLPLCVMLDWLRTTRISECFSLLSFSFTRLILIHLPGAFLDVPQTLLRMLCPSLLPLTASAPFSWLMAHSPWRPSLWTKPTILLTNSHSHLRLGLWINTHRCGWREPGVVSAVTFVLGSLTSLAYTHLSLILPPSPTALSSHAFLSSLLFHSVLFCFICLF